jgi:DNA repair exonuclease SbcCD ATPase subunit
MDVEAILKEIRNRVVSEGRANDAEPSNGSAPQSNQTESLTRVSAHLSVTSRAWDRLPPLVSNRRGALARIELWLKRTSKPLTRWFTWEQVNFNRAVKDALSDVVEILKAQAQELAGLRAQLAHEAGERREVEKRLNAAIARLTEIATNLTDTTSSLGSKHSSLESEHSKLANQVIELAAQLRAEDQQIKTQQSEEIESRLSELAAELKDEQRVCFRQVSLEATESAVLEDRARRDLLTRLERLEASLKALAAG